MSVEDRTEVEQETEQAYITSLYDRLDELRKRASDRLAGTLRQVGGTPAARTEREALTIMYRQQLAQLDAAENGLCFGRLEFNDGARSYIGRLGMHADNENYDQLLMDWRADAARPFYLATAASPGDVRVRRHIKTRARTVQRLDDEVLDLAVADPTRHEGLAGESSLLAALNASRTGRMRDIVETIQAEQDLIIRSGLPGVLVVEGGPGTGKTAVALHRAAYLLYTYRRQLEKRGVLLIGPNATFLRYIGQVLPSLGETSVLLETIGDLMPGIAATGTEPAEVARIKGTPVMAKVVAAAVRDRQRVPHEGLAISFERTGYRLSSESLARARERARRSRRPHNQARRIFIRDALDELARVVAGRLGANPLGGSNLLGRADIEDLRAELRDDPDVRAAIGRLWPVLTPQQLIGNLFASRRLLAAAARSLTADERELLHRPAGWPWTPADVPLLDEAAELLGEDDRGTKAAARRREEEEAFAQGVLEIIGRDEEDDPEILMGADMLDAARLAARFDSEVHLTAAERAAADRTWAFGHVIVDEAQELSPMAWRMVMRRCPARSMTIVGDVAQTGDISGTASWSGALGPFVGDRWRLAPLTVNYRTPAEIMTVAADVLAQIDPQATPPRSVRESGTVPWRLGVTDPGALPRAVADAAVAMTALTGGDTLAVIVPEGRQAEIGAAVRAALPDAGVGDSDPGAPGGGEPDLERPVVVLTVRQAKGLEFDSVLVADPALILAESSRGLGDLYVALTRATQRAGVVYAAELPPVLARLTEVSGVGEVGLLEAGRRGLPQEAEVA
ncbi:MAG TPA: ATP-binding domain-containing protein [Streptosporangiaceae bacterium]